MFLKKIFSGKNSNAKSNKPSDTAVKKYVELGQQADDRLAAGQPMEAIELYQQILADMDTTQVVDMYILGKIALGLMLACLKTGDFEQAHYIALLDMESVKNDILGLGTAALGKGLAGIEPRDRMIFLMGQAFFHANSTGDTENAQRIIAYYFNQVVDYAIDQDASLYPNIFTVWQAYYTILFDGAIPAEAFNDIAEAANDCAYTVENNVTELNDDIIKKFIFPKPAQWTTEPREVKYCSSCSSCSG